MWGEEKLYQTKWVRVYPQRQPITFKRTGIENNENELNPKVKKRQPATDKFFHETEEESRKFISLWLTSSFYHGHNLDLTI